MSNLSESLEESVQAAPVDNADSATLFLARRYAALIDAFADTPDEADVLKDLGPKLLATLDALGLTPKARGRVKKVKEEVTGDGDPGAATLDELRQRRQQRTG